MNGLAVKKSRMDLVIILSSMIITFLFLGLYQAFHIDLGKFPLLVQTMVWALVEYGMMGLGISIVCFLRKESFASFGLKKDKLLPTLLLSAAVCLPELLYIASQKGGITYFPFQAVNFTKPVLAAGFPVNLIGMMMIAASWGFFEGFSYVVIYDRINKLLPAKHVLLNWGAILCGIVCLLMHVLVGQTFGLEAIVVFIIIYGMLVTYSITKNAWGCVFIFCLYWNAIL